MVKKSKRKQFKKFDFNIEQQKNDSTLDGNQNIPTPQASRGKPLRGVISTVDGEASSSIDIQKIVSSDSSACYECDEEALGTAQGELIVFSESMLTPQVSAEHSSGGYQCDEENLTEAILLENNLAEEVNESSFNDKKPDRKHRKTSLESNDSKKHVPSEKEFLAKENEKIWDEGKSEKRRDLRREFESRPQDLEREVIDNKRNRITTGVGREETHQKSISRRNIQWEKNYKAVNKNEHKTSDGERKKIDIKRDNSEKKYKVKENNNSWNEEQVDKSNSMPSDGYSKNFRYNKETDHGTSSNKKMHYKYEDGGHATNSRNKQYNDNTNRNASRTSGSHSRCRDSSFSKGAVPRKGVSYSVVSPRSSTLNPEANSFHLTDERQSEEQVDALETAINVTHTYTKWHNSSEEKPKRRSDPIEKTACRKSKYNSVVSTGKKVLDSETNSSQISENSWSNNSFNKSKNNANSSMLVEPCIRSRNDMNSSQCEDQIPYTPPNKRSLDNLFHWNKFRDDAEWKTFEEYLRSEKCNKFDLVKEIIQDLFAMDKDYSLAHCVAEDMNMGSGIAVEFRRTFKRVEELLGQRQRQGGLAILEESNRFIYYLVTKTFSTGKPTYETLWSSLKKMRDHIKKYEVKKLALPRIGCGLDRLEWNLVKPMLEFLFSDMAVEILVCNFQQDENSTQRLSVRKCKIVNENYHITDIEPETIILYFGSRDGAPTNTIKELNDKFNFKVHYTQAVKKLGEPISFTDKTGKYVLYGCIVKDSINDSFDFKYFEKCLRVIQQNNRKDGFGYVGFQRVEDDDDLLLNDKILNIMKHSLKDVDIYCCNSEKNASKDISHGDSSNKK